MEATHYHAAVAGYLERQEPDLWRWAASAAQEDLREVRLHLLKTTYQMSPEAHPALHDAARRAAQALGIAPAVSLYQSNDGQGANVAIYTAPDEAHIIFQGEVLAMLSGAEVDAVLGHELAHYLLWEREQGRYRIASRILERIAHEERAGGVWTNTASRFGQYTEIYADRGAYAACRDIGPCIASLVKIGTGTREVHVESYLEQAGRVLAHEGIVSEGVSHPQTFIRAHALAMHAAGDAGLDTALAALLKGPADLDTLDILDQVELQQFTRSLIARLLGPAWYGSDGVLALARRYFADYQHGEAPQPRHTGAQGAIAPPQGHKLAPYLAFVLLDFALVDPALEDLPLAAALRMAQELGIGEQFESLLLQQTKIKKPALAKLKLARDDLLARAQTASPAAPT